MKRKNHKPVPVVAFKCQQCGKTSGLWSVPFNSKGLSALLCSKHLIARGIIFGPGSIVKSIKFNQ